MSSPSYVQFARAGDEHAIFALCMMAHAEIGLSRVNKDKVLDMIHRCVRKDGGVIGLIKDAEGNIEAGTGLRIGEGRWYSSEMQLYDIFTFVHPAHRKSRHAQALLQFQKDFANSMAMELIVAVTTNKELMQKMRLFQRTYHQIGAVFGFNNRAYDQFVSQKELEQPRRASRLQGRAA